MKQFYKQFILLSFLMSIIGFAFAESMDLTNPSTNPNTNTPITRDTGGFNTNSSGGLNTDVTGNTKPKTNPYQNQNQFQNQNQMQNRTNY